MNRITDSRLYYTIDALQLLARLAIARKETFIVKRGESKASLILPILKAQVRRHWLRSQLAD